MPAFAIAGSAKSKEKSKKRKLGRNPRIPFTQHQVSLLEQKFRATHYLSSVDVAELSTTLNLTENRVRAATENFFKITLSRKRCSFEIPRVMPSGGSTAGLIGLERGPKACSSPPPHP